MISDLIIRVKYEGVTYDLDVINEVPLRVDMSTVEVGELGRLFGIGSQQFTLPGTKKNNKFFKNAYDIAADNPPGMYNSIDGYVIQNGETLLFGQFQLMEVVTDEDGFVNYNVQISDRVIQFNEEIKGKYLRDGDWSAYTHTLTSSSIVDSWSGNLLSGSVFYPLAEYGRPDNEQGSDPYPYLGFYQGYLMGTQLRPIHVEQFLPAIKVKDAIDVIFDQVGFLATGSFLEKPEIGNLYMLTKANDQFGPVVPSASATFIAQGNSTNELVFLGTTGSKVPVQVESFDPLNAYNTSTYEYTAQASGDHTFNGSISFFNPNNVNGTVVRIKLELRAGSYPSATSIIETVEQDFASTGEGGGIGPFTLSVAGTTPMTAAVDNAWIQISYTKISGAGTPPSLVLLGTTGRQFRCTSAPKTYKGATIDMSLQFNPELKSEDVIKALITQFNLVMVPDPNNPSVIQIETFDDWIRSGNFVDWNDKYDTSQRVSITHTINELPKQVILTQAEDNDRLSKVTKEQEPYRQYGSLELFATSNNALGEDKLETVFAPIILGGVYDASALGSSSFDIDTTSITVYPHLYKYENDKILPYGFKPRLGFRVNNNLPSGSLIHIGDPSGGGSYTGATISGSYGTLSNLSQLPGVAGSTVDLHFNNTYTDFGSSALNLDSAVDSFNNYWKTYYDSLYWDDAKKVTLSAKFDPYEYKNIKLNDKILIKNQYYRINKIKGFNVSYRDVVEVELIRLYPAYFQYTPASGPVVTPSVTPSVSVTPTISVTPSITPTPSPTATPGLSPTATPTSTPTPSPTSTPGGITPTPTNTPTSTVTPTPSPSVALYYEFENCDNLNLVYQESVAPGITTNDRYSDGFTNFIYTGNTTTLPGTVVTNLTYVGSTGCIDPPPSPSPVIQTVKAQITNCGGSTTWFVEFLNYSSLPNNFAIESSQINLDGQCWEIIDNAYPGPIDFQANIDNIYSSCASCVPPTPTPTVTPTPSPSTVFYSFTTVYSAVSELAACEVVSPTVTVYSTCSTITVGCRLYDSTSVFDYAADGWYHDINNGEYYYVEGNGYVAETGVCTAPSPTPTPSPSTAPCTAILMQEIGSATSSAACSGASATTTRGHNGLGSEPSIGDTVYARDTCAATFNGGNLWYFVSGDTSAIQINSSGLVVNKELC